MTFWSPRSMKFPLISLWEGHKEFSKGWMFHWRSNRNQEELGICICQWSGCRSKFGRSSTVDAASRRTRWFGSCFWAWFTMEVFWRLEKPMFFERPVRYGSFEPNIGFVAYAIAVVTWLLLVQNWWYVMIELILRVWSTICLKIQATSIS